MRTIAHSQKVLNLVRDTERLVHGSGSKTERLDLARQLRSQWSELRGDEWAQLDRAFRQDPLYLNFTWREKLKRSVAERIVGRFPIERLGWKVLAMSHDGYLRQRALEELIADARGDELPLLLLRSTDWVPQVRDVARAALENCVLPRHLRRFLDQWALVVRLEPSLRARCTIDDLASVSDASDPMRARITRLAMSGIDSGILSDRFADEDLFVRRSAFALALRAAGEPQLPWMLGAAFEGPDFVVQWTALQYVGQLEDQASRRYFLEQAASSSSPGLRRQALYTWLELDPEGVPLERMSVDTSGGLRSAARYFLRKRGTPDLAQPARDALDGNLEGMRNKRPARTLAGYLNALGETGVKSDGERLAPYLEHEAARVRRAAAKALADLEANKNASEQEG